MGDETAAAEAESAVSQSAPPDKPAEALAIPVEPAEAPADTAEAPADAADAADTAETPVQAVEAPAEAAATPADSAEAEAGAADATAELPVLTLDALESPSPAEPAASLAAEPDYPPPNSVPRPPPPVALKSYPPPVVDEISPSAGPVLGGTKLTLVGKNLLRATIVRVDGVIAQTVGADEPRELRVLTPSTTKSGQVDISVENPFVAPLVLSRAFRYDRLAPPRIVSVAPDHLATKGGAELTVVGEGFVAGVVVLFDGKPTPAVRLVSSKELEVKSPPGEDGKMVDVTVKNPDGQTAIVRRAFLYDKRFG